MEIRKSILIIKANPKALGSVETFLKNRGWVIFSTSDIKDAFSFLVKNKPSFVMVPADHPFKKIRTLPKLLIQAFPVCIIGYAENSTTQSYKMLMDSSAEYKVNPPATGPAVERAVNKFMKDQQTLISEAASQSLKLDLLKELQEKIQKNKIDEQAASFLNFPVDGVKPSVSSEGAPPAFSSDENSEDLADLLKQLAETNEKPEVLKTEQKRPVKGAAYMPKHGDAKEQPSSSNSEPEAVPPADSLAPVLSSKNKSKKISENSFEPLGDQNPAEDRPESASFLESHNSKGRKKQKQKVESEVSKKGFIPEYHEDDLFDDSGALKQLEAPVLDFELKSKKPPVVAQENDSNEGPARDHQKAKPTSLISQAAEKALNESVNKGDGQIKNKLQASSNVACIIVESARFSGYLVAAMGKNRQIDQKFIGLIKDRLGKFLKEQDEATTDEGLNIKIKEVDFEGWALEYADFLRKSIHNGDELAMAFFPFSPIKNELGQSAAAEMGAIKLEDLHGELEVEFNLYIYLSANNRYVLYTPKGSKLYGSQKDRLSKMGVTHLHIRKSEAQDLSKYRAQNYLNSKILEYEQKKGLARSA